MRSIEVVCAGSVIGYVQKINPQEDRKVWQCREIGNEDLAELVPGGPDNMKITMDRVMLYQSRLQQILDDWGGNHGNARTGIRSLMDYNMPFDVMVLMRRHNATSTGGDFLTGDPLDSGIGGNINEIDGGNPSTVFILDWFHECWMTNISYTVEAKADFQIIESCSVEYTWRTGSELFTGSSSMAGSQTNNTFTLQNNTL